MKNHTGDILFLCQYFYPEQNSSATLPFDTASFLAGEGLQIGAMCGYPKDYTDQQKVPLKETVNGVSIHRLRYWQLKRTNRFGRLINFFSFTIQAMMHLNEIGKYCSVIVYSNPPVLPLVAWLAKKLYGTEMIFVSYDVYPEIAIVTGSIRSGSLIDRVMRKINHRVFQSAQVVTLSDEMSERLLMLRPELTPDRIKTISNWAHEGLTEDRASARSRFGYRTEDFVVSYLGNMGICQDMETLATAVEILAEEKNIHFLLVGHGSKLLELQNRLGRLPHVQMHNFLSGEDFEQAVAAGDCCVVSLEPGLSGLCFPSKYYSYLQGGKPVISIMEPDSAISREILEQNIGTNVPQGDAERLAYAIRAMATERAETTEAGQRAAALYQARYTKALALERYHSFLVRREKTP